MKIALTIIASLENRYIREFVQYYQKLGVDKIFLIDNNNPQEPERFDDVISDYIDSGYVQLFDWREGHKPVVAVYESYTYVYNNFGKDFDWMFFCDCDEFLTIEDMSLREFLMQPKFEGFQAIAFNWLSYGDGGNVYYEDKPLLERITKPIEPRNDFYENHKIKCIVRCGLKNLEFKSPHYPYFKSTKYICCDCNGLIIPIGYETQIINVNKAYVKHFRTKTIQEYCENKIVKLNCKGYTRIFFNDNFFFSYNNWTKEKQEYYDNFIKNHPDIFKFNNLPNNGFNEEDITFVTFRNNQQELDVVTPFLNGAKYVCFTTNNAIKSDIWKIVYVDTDYNDNVTELKMKYSVLEYIDTRYAIYLDKNTTINKEFSDLLGTMIGNDFSLGLICNHNTNSPLQLTKTYLVGKQSQQYLYSISHAIKYTEKNPNKIFCPEGCFFICRNDEQNRKLFSTILMSLASTQLHYNCGQYQCDEPIIANTIGKLNYNIEDIFFIDSSFLTSHISSDVCGNTDSNFNFVAIEGLKIPYKPI